MATLQNYLKAINLSSYSIRRVKYWQRLPGEVVGYLSLEILKTQLYKTLSNLLSLNLLWAKGWTKWALEVPCNLHDCVIQNIMMIIWVSILCCVKSRLMYLTESVWYTKNFWFLSKVFSQTLMLVFNRSWNNVSSRWPGIRKYYAKVQRKHINGPENNKIFTFTILWLNWIIIRGMTAKLILIKHFFC